MSNNYFTFNNKIYKQVFGMLVGTLISPTFCDLVMQDLEQIVLNSLDFDIPLYFKYVDDIILAPISWNCYILFQE